MNSNRNNNNNLDVAVDAPPPYSETDIYSTTSAPSHSPRSNSGLHSFPHTHSHGAEDAASHISSTSTTEPVIFTPPLTPRTNDANTSNIAIPSSPSAALYFEEHPTLSLSPRPELRVHSVSVRARSVPDDVPYPADWAAQHHVTPQDWATFVNFLLPDHDASMNEALLGEKAKTEDGSSTGGKSEHAPFDPDEVMQRRAEAEAMVRQWNDGFFGPRGVTVRLEQVDHSTMPGAWNVDFDGQSGTEGPEGLSTQRETQPTQRRQGWRPSFAGFRADSDGLRWGESFVADSNGLRIGSLIMDNNGIRMGQGAGQARGPPTGHPPSHRHPIGFGGAGPSQPGIEPNYGPGYPCNYPTATGPDHWDRRGRHGHRHGARSRSRSSSSSSSSSSNSSRSSASVGSLPDYDDVQPQQLPVYIGYLEAWLAQSNQMRTKADIRQLRSEIKASKTGTLDPSVDSKELKTRLKALTQQWRALKGQQKRERRERKREAKRRRRAEKREKRQQKRELRRSRKDHRRLGRGGPHSPPHSPPPPLGVPHSGPQIHVPPINMPQVSVPPFNVPSPFGGPSCSPWGRGGNRGWGCHGPSNRGGFFGPKCPLGPGGFFGSQPRGPSSPKPHNVGPAGPFPGAWPDNDSDQNHLPSPGPAPAAKYLTAAGLETEIGTMQADLAAKDVSLGERRAVEKEIEALTEKLENVRFEADEAYARELAAIDC